MSSTQSASKKQTDRVAWEPVLIQQVGGAQEDEGRRVLIGDGLLLGRENPIFADRYPTLSRTHAEITVEKGGRLRVTDLGSRHGTYVQGQRVERATLTPGDLIELGNVSFVVALAPASFVPQKHPRFAFASYAFATLLETISAARRSRRTVVITGEPGVGKSALAEELCETDGSVVPTSVRSVDLSLSSPPPTALGGGVLVFDRLDEAEEAAQRRLLAAMRKAESDPRSPRVAVLSCATPEELASSGKLLAPLLAYLEGWVLRVPPLRERPEDVLPIVRAQLRALSPEERWDVSPALLQRLVRDRWTGNVRALLSEVERLYLCATEACLADRPVGHSPSSTLRAAPTRVASDGSWVEGVDGRREALGGRRVLRAVLTALLDAHERGLPLSSREIARLAWPGERMLPRAAANRVYVAVTSLRKLGFGACIENAGDGYRFSAGCIEIVRAD